MSDEAQSGRAARYKELLEKFAQWTPATISNLPLTQLFAVFGEKEDTHGSWAEALPAMNKVRAEKGLPPLKLVGKQLVVDDG